MCVYIFNRTIYVYSNNILNQLNIYINLIDKYNYGNYFSGKKDIQFVQSVLADSGKSVSKNPSVINDHLISRRPESLLSGYCP